MEELFRVGVISNTHGIRGEVKVYPTTDNVRRFDDLKEVILDTGKEQLNLHVTSVKYFKNMVILKFKEFDNINDIIPLQREWIYLLQERTQFLWKRENIT